MYINGSWVEIDTSKDIKIRVNNEDMTDWERPDSPYCYDGFYNEIVNNVTPIEVNDTLWTYDIVNWRQDTIAIG